MSENDSCFIDTNIWLYAFIQGDVTHKTARAKEIIESATPITVSAQVINEVCINLYKKAHFTEAQLQQLALQRTVPIL